VHFIELLGVTDGAVAAGFGGVALVMMAVGLLLSVFWIWMLIDCLASSMPSSEKLLWFLVIFLTHIIGAVLYLRDGAKWQTHGDCLGCATGTIRENLATDERRLTQIKRRKI
jgi:hypothetical protein